MAFDEPALGDITGVGGALQCGQVFLVRSRGEVVHHTVGKERKKEKNIYKLQQVFTLGRLGGREVKGPKGIALNLSTFERKTRKKKKKKKSWGPFERGATYRFETGCSHRCRYFDPIRIKEVNPEDASPFQNSFFFFLLLSISLDEFFFF